MIAERLFSITLFVSLAAHAVAFVVEPDLFAMTTRKIVEIPVQLHEPPPPPPPKPEPPKPKPPKKVVRPKVRPIPPKPQPKPVEAAPCDKADVADRVVERPAHIPERGPKRSDAPALSAADIKALVRAYLRQLRGVVERNKRYPNLARRNGIEGAVRLRFMIQPDGRINEIHVVASSGVAMLDEAAIQALQAASGSVSPPKAIKGKPIRSSVKLNFELN